MRSTTFRRPAFALALALAGLAAVQTTAARGQDTAPQRARYSFASVGLAPGQSLRVSVFQPPPTNDTPPPINDRVRVLIVAANGDTVLDTGEVSLPPGPIRFLTIPREKLDRTGEADTGRLQVRVVVLVTSGGDLPPGPSVPAVEVLTTANGRTTVEIPPGPPDRF